MTTTSHREGKGQMKRRTIAGADSRLAHKPRATQCTLNQSLATFTRPSSILRQPLCCTSLEGKTRTSSIEAGNFAAAQEPSVGLTLPTPKILSAINHNRRPSLSYAILGGGDPSTHHFSLCTVLRPAQAPPPRSCNAQSPARTHSTFSGATGLDKKTGAAIQRRLAPEKYS